MKKLSLAFLTSLFCFYSFAQAEDYKVSIGVIDSVQSTILNEKRKIWVHIPKSDPNSPFAKQRYPVVYLLDGNRHFTSVVGMIEELSLLNICPEMIVVGIPNTQRIRDLTPSRDLSDTTSGGGENFISFIQKELVPYIDSIYPTQKYKMLVGLSVGGLTVMNAIINHTKLFNSYVCMEPSMWWDNQSLLKIGKKALSQNDFMGRSLYLGIANTMTKDMDINRVEKDTTKATVHIRSILELDNYIKNTKPKGLIYASKYYENENHSSVHLIAAYDAFRFLFKQYLFDVSPKEYEDSTFDMAKKYALQYNELSMIPPEAFGNMMATTFLRLKQYKKAEGLFKLNISNYPTSFNAYNSYGNYFVAIDNKPKAIENFKKALSIREYPETRQKLNKLLE